MHDRFKDVWDGEDRRDNESARPDRVSSIESLVIKHVHANRAHFDERIDAMEQSLTKLITSAFPDGPEKHHAYHAELIQTAVERKKFWTGIKEKLMLGIVGSVGLFIYTAVVEALKHEVKK